MKKITILSLTLISLFAAAVLLPGCTSPASSPAAVEKEPTLSPNQLLVTTQFGRMMGKVPYWFLEKHDVWFGNPKAAKELHGIQDLNSTEAYLKLSPDQSKQVAEALQGVVGTFSRASWQRIEPLTGLDVAAVDRAVFTDTPPPWAFSLNEGTFDFALTSSKLLEQGYQKVDYGSTSYYSIRDDFQMDLKNPISLQVLAYLNRVAVSNNTVITAPATDIMTGILDAMDGKQLSVVDSPDCRALVLSMGDVLSGVVMNPERTLDLNYPQGMPPFDFTVPADWGLLHQYGMTGIGYKDDGKDRYMVISLYYKNPADATADAQTLVNRMKSYTLNTRFEPSSGQRPEPQPLTDIFEVGQPKVQNFPWGAATLTVENKFKLDFSGGYWHMPMVDYRDLLFLAPDPTPYVKK